MVNKTLPQFPFTGYSNSIQQSSASLNFYGVPVHDCNFGVLKYGAAFTLPLTGIYLSLSYYKGKALTDVIRHEFGHALQYKRYGIGYFFVVAPVSIHNAMYAASHMQTWTEAEANTISYKFLGKPADWNFVDYPIDQNYFNNLRSAILKP
jgi:hypothetical protein